MKEIRFKEQYKSSVHVLIILENGPGLYIIGNWFEYKVFKNDNRYIVLCSSPVINYIEVHIFNENGKFISDSKIRLMN